MRILAFVQDAFGGRGGIAQFNRDILSGLAAAPGVTTVAALPRRVVDPAEPVPAGIAWKVGAARGRLAYVATAAVILQRPWDLIVFAHINLLPLAALPRLGRSKSVLLIYGIDAWSPIGADRTRRQLAALDSVLAISDFTRDRFREWSGVDPKRVDLLPCMVDLARFRPGPAPAGLRARYGLAGRRVIMTLARLAGQERYKGIDEVMEAMPGLLGRFPDLVYLVVGDGDDRPRLEARSRALGIAERVVFTGYIDEAEKADHYRLADVFALAGRGEGFGIVLLEAMACGIPVVGSNRDASGDVVRTAGGGIVVDPTDPADLAAGLAAALERPRDVVPPGLARFGREAFLDRLGQVLIDPHRPRPT